MIELRDFPAQMWRGLFSDIKGLLRDYMLRGVMHPQAFDMDDIGRADHALMELDQYVRQYDGGAARVTIFIPKKNSHSLDFLQGIADDAASLARAGEMLLAPTLPEILSLRNWVYESITQQMRGAEPVPYDQRRELEWMPPLAQWQNLGNLDPTQAWVVADDLNRIVAVSDPLLEMLRWTRTDLVGQRLLVIVPPEYRDRHLKGLNRNVATGESTIPMGTPLPLFAYRRDNTQIPINLVLTRHAALEDRVVFLGVMEPRPHDSPDVIADLLSNAKAAGH